MNKYGSYKDNSVLAELYDLVPGYIGRPDSNFYQQYATATTGRILELGCGTGRVLLPIAESGCRITGLDSSEHMLAQCQRKLNSRAKDVQDRVRLVQGDMTRFALDDVYHLTIIPFRAFQHLIAVDDQLSCLRHINRHLAIKAKLILDVFQVDLERVNNPRFMEEMEDVAEYELPDGRRLRRAHRVTGFHPVEQYNEVELIYYLTNTDGSTERIVHAFPFRYFFRYEMQYLLERCGFELIDLFGDFDKSQLSSDSPEMVFVAEKRSESK